MKYLTGEEETKAMEFLYKCADLARQATCKRAKCGSVIVKGAEIIGEGFNTPPKGLESQRRCDVEKDTYHRKVNDKTCCMHAEHRAIIDAFQRNFKKVEGSRIYFMRLDENDNLTRSGNPFCTICSKLALDSGVAEFVLWQEEGVCVYDTEEYNTLSYQYRG